MEKIIDKVKRYTEEIMEDRLEGNEIDVEKSLLNEYSFSSIDVMDLLIKIRDEFFMDNQDFDAMEMLNMIYEEYECGLLTVKSISKIMYDLSNKCIEGDIENV